MDDFARLKASIKKPEEFEEIYKKYADTIFNYFWYRTGHDKALSEDLMQETFLRAFERRSTYEAQGRSYLTYLMTIAHNLLVDYYRKPKSIPVEDLPIDVVPYEITENLIHKSDAEALWRAIQTLPQHQRDVLLMFYQQNMPVKDIASVLHVTENAVKLILSRTRKKLADHPYLQDIARFAGKKRRYVKPRFLRKK